MCQATPSFTHLPLGHASPLAGSKGVLQVSEPIAAALDVDDMGVVQRSIENGRGEGSIAGKQLGPLSYAPLWRTIAARSPLLSVDLGRHFWRIGCVQPEE